MTLENQDSPSGQDQTGHNPKETHDQGVGVATKLESPPPKTECNNACKEQKHWLDYLTFGMELIGLAVLCVYAGYTIKIWQANRQSADAATQTLTAMQNQFQLDQRPLLVTAGFTMKNMKTRKPSPLVQGQPLVIDIVIKNIGKSVALNMIIHRHITFGESLFQQFRPEPPDTKKSGDALGQGQPTLTTAVSIKNPFANETADIAPADPARIFLPASKFQQSVAPVARIRAVALLNSSKIHGLKTMFDTLSC